MVGGEEAGMYNITQEKTVEVFADCQLFADNGQIGSGKHIVQD